MNGDPPSDRTARLDDGGATVSDSSAVTQAEASSTSGPASPAGGRDRVEAADPDEPGATLAGESIGPEPVATVAGESVGPGTDATLAGESISLETARTLADRSHPGDGKSSASAGGAEAATMGGEAPFGPTDPGAQTLADEWRGGATPRPKPVLPGYEILSELGRGGMGVVYLARQVRLNRLCALKMILAGDHASREAALRFQTEAETIARLRHGNIVQIYHIGDCDGRVYYEMEYIEGGSLEARLDGTPWPAARAAAMVEELACGVGAAHQLGIVHRDLKPGNILMDADGTPRIADFGLAKTLNVQSGLTQTDSVLGSPSYMAPEQAGGHAKDVGPAADVYALGAILYELLTGRPPFKAATLLETLEQVKTIEPVSPTRLVPGLPHDIETICLKCLQKEPSRRYPDAAALVEDLRRYQAGEPIQARRITRVERTWRWCRRNPAMAGMIATLLFVLAGGFAATTVLWLRADRMRLEAEENFRKARAAVDDYLTRVAESRLLGVPGFQPLRKELLESALPYYESFVKQRAEDPALARELASAHGRLARINADLGRLPEALEGYRKSLEILTRPGRAEPGVEDEVARCHQSIGDVFRRGEDLAAAMSSYKTAEEIWRKLTGIFRDRNGQPERNEPAGVSARRRDALALLLDRMGAAHEKSGDMEKAVQCYGEAVRIEWDILRGNEQTGDRTGTDQHLARMFSKVGDLQVQMNMDPGALRWVVGNAVTDTSDFGGGASDRFPFYKRAETILTRLIRDLPAEPRIDDFRRDLADCREHNADALTRIEKNEEAQAAYREALEIRRRLARTNPAVPEYREGLARVGSAYGRLLDRAGKRDDALELYRLAVEHQRMVVETSPGAVPPVRDLTRQLATMADAERRAGRLSQATDAYGEVVDLLGGVSQPNAEDLYLLATAHAARAGLAGQGKARLSGPERERADHSAADAVAALSRAIDAGFEGHDRATKETSLEPLRSRDDFKAQMARLAEISRGPEWLTDLADAKRRAAARGKDLLVYFSGSDWCPWCHLLKKSVFDRRPFAQYAARHLVLVQLDEPHRGAPPKNADVRDALTRRWGVYSVPSVFLADAEGRPYATVEGTASEQGRSHYTEDLDRLRGHRTARDEALSRAASARGLDRAVQLGQALDAMKTLSPYVVMAEYATQIAEIFELDPADRNGLKARFGQYAEVAWNVRHEEAREALERRDWKGALDRSDAILAELKPSGQMSQETRITRARALKGLGKAAEAEAELGRALEPGRKAVEERRAALDAAPGDPERRKALSEAYSQLIVTLREAGQSAEAVATAMRRGALWPGEPTELYNVACELALSVPAPEANRAGERPADPAAEAGRRKLADQAMEMLGRAVLIGFNDARWMKRDPDLEVLRTRDDFRAMVRSLRELGGPSTPASELRRLAGHAPNSPPLVVALPDGHRVLSAGGDGTLRLWDVEAGREVGRREIGGQPLALALSADGRRALTGGLDRSVKIWDVEGSGEPGRIELNGNVISLACSTDGRRGLAGLADGTIRLLDLDAGRETGRLQGAGARTVRAIAFSPDGRRAISGSDDNSVRLWDLETRGELRRLVDPRGPIWSVALSPDGRRALAGCDDGVLYTWDLGDRRKVGRLESGAGPVRAAAFATEGRRAVSAHGTGALIVWDLDAGREVLRLHGNAGRPNLAALPEGRRVLTGDGDGVIRLWSLDEELVRPRELDLLGRWAEAGAALERSLGGRTDDPRLWTLRGRHDMLLGRWDEAVADFRKAIELGRDDALVLSLVAGALQVEAPSPGEGSQRLLDLLDPRAPRAVTLWMKLERPALGIDGVPLPDGLRLASIDPKGPAAKAGLRAGDILSEVAGRPVVDVATLRVALKGHAAGDRVAVSARRDASSFRSTVELGSVPIPQVSRQGLAREALDADHRRFLDAGYRAAYITAYLGGRGKPTYAGLWLKDDRPCFARIEAAADVFEKQSRELPPGYRLDWLQVSGDPGRRRWSAVWVEDPDRVPWELQTELDRSQLSVAIDRRAGQGFRPALIAAASGPGDETRYASVWIKDGTPSRARVHITANELQQELASLSAGWRPGWVDAYKEKGARFYTAVFVKDDSRAEWQLIHDTPEWGMQTILKKMGDDDLWPVLLDVE